MGMGMEDKYQTSYAVEIGRLSGESLQIRKGKNSFPDLVIPTERYAKWNGREKKPECDLGELLIPSYPFEGPGSEELIEFIAGENQSGKGCAIYIGTPKELGERVGEFAYPLVHTAGDFEKALEFLDKATPEEAVRGDGI